MELSTRFFRRLAILFRRSRFRTELDEEMAFHREQAEREFVAGGMTPEKARFAAIRQLGNSTRLKELSHRQVAFRAEAVVQDLRFALRQSSRHPGFALTAILILTLGMGVSVAIFAFVDAALLEPLPYAQPARLMSVNESSDQSGRWPLSHPDFLDWQRLNKSFTSLDVYSGSGYLLRGNSGAEPVQGERVSGGFFRTLGVRPVLGRDFNQGENRVGGPNVVILSYGAWLHRFGARSEVVGETVDLDNHAYTVIGVLPRSFSFAPSGNAEFWAPINTLSHHEQSRNFYPFLGVGRLRDGVSQAAALTEMKGIAQQLQRQYPNPGREQSADVVPLAEIIVGDVRPILLTLLGGSILLLLIACVNVASLLLVRSESRRREIAVRGALGATPARLTRQFIIEGLVLTVCGSLAGVLAAVGLMRVLARLVPKDMAASMPFLAGVGLNPHTAAFAAAIALLAAVLLAATPTLRLSFLPVREGLAEGGRGAAGLLWRRLGANLVVLELAIAVVLLAGAGLLGQSLYRLLHVPIGFDPNHLATLRVMAQDSAYKDRDKVSALYQEVQLGVSSLPGVEALGLTSLAPVECDCAVDGIRIVGRPAQAEFDDVDERHVSPTYLPTLKAALLRGRFFTDADDSSKPGVALINQTLARKYFAGQDPVGQKIADNEGGFPTQWEIVGVVDDVHEGTLDAPTAPAEYFPIKQTPDHDFTLVVRTSQDAETLLPVLVGTLHRIDPNLGVSDEATMIEKIDATQSALLHRFAAWLVGGFAAMALVLGVVGLYGVIAFSVSQRTREIGVRMALGAQRGSVYALVMRQAGWLTASGLAIGLVCSIGVSMLIRKLLFGVEAWDAITLAGVALLLGLASLAAGFSRAPRRIRESGGRASRRVTRQSDAQGEEGMNAMTRLFRRLAILFGRRRYRTELDEEMAFHREQAEREFMAAGMTPDQARYAAARRFGNSARLRERSHEVVGFRAETILLDLRFAFRQMFKNPSYAVVAILILALGMGVSVAIFGFVDAALLQPLPYSQPNRLVDVDERAKVFPRSNLSYQDWLDWKRMNTTLSSLDVYTSMGYLLRTGSGSEPVQAARVSDGFFSTLGVRAMLGRVFLPGEDQPGRAKLVILSYGAWLKRFGARQDIVGTTVSLSGDTWTIVGVLPREFAFAPRGNAEFWTPILDLSPCEKRRSCHNLDGVGRLRDGVTQQQTLADFTGIARQLEKLYPGSNRDQGASVQPLSEFFVWPQHAAGVAAFACRRRFAAAHRVHQRGQPGARAP